MEVLSIVSKTLEMSRENVDFKELQKNHFRVMYVEETRDVPVYVNNYGKSSHGGQKVTADNIS